MLCFMLWIKTRLEISNTPRLLSFEIPIASDCKIYPFWPKCSSPYKTQKGTFSYNFWLKFTPLISTVFKTCSSVFLHFVCIQKTKIGRGHEINTTWIQIGANNALYLTDLLNFFVCFKTLGHCFLIYLKKILTRYFVSMT